MVVIASDPAQPLPASIGQRLQGYRLSREFIVLENVFGYRTIVKVYLPAQEAPQVQTIQEADSSFEVQLFVRVFRGDLR